ncbi:MipA/OmpV family protein [Erwinia sp.]|uniref:MipA/OmpV family protein n=1 Tax=Erwinia citreus TaxID=558 RepID=UPI003C7114FD
MYGVDGGLTWSHQFTRHWSRVISAYYTWLGDSASKSPVVDQHGGTTLDFAVLYMF